MSDIQGYGLFERFAKHSQSAASKLSVKSALNPMLWLCGIITLPCFAISALTSSPDLSHLLSIVGIVPVGVTCFGFLYFMVFRPEKLQSEEYQIRQEVIELMRQKGSDIAIAPSSLEAIANPMSARQVITDIKP